MDIILSWNNPIDLLINKINPLKTKDLKRRRNAQLTFRCCILYIFSTNMHTEYFKLAAKSPCFFFFKMPFISQCYFCFYIIEILNTECAKIEM